MSCRGSGLTAARRNASPSVACSLPPVLGAIDRVSYDLPFAESHVTARNAPLASSPGPLSCLVNDPTLMERTERLGGDPKLATPGTPGRTAHAIELVGVSISHRFVNQVVRFDRGIWAFGYPTRCERRGEWEGHQETTDIVLGQTLQTLRGGV